MEQGIRTDYNSKEDKRRNIQNTETAPNIKYKHDLHVVHQLACIGCTIIGLSCWNYNKYDRVQRHCIKLAYCLRNQHFPPEKHPRITATPWWDEVSNANILTSQACTPNSSLIWFGHVYCMVGRILKDIFCGEMAAGKWITDRSHLRLVNVCKRDIRALDIDMDVLGMPWSRPHKVETYPESKTPHRRGEADKGRGRQEGTQKKEQQPY